jgi:uncharacterized RDD family membrane protein YckC
VPESNLIIAWRPAELWRRILAKVLDGLFFLLLLSPVVDYGVRSSFRWHNIGPFALVTLLFPALEIVLTKVFQGTPGKRILGLRVLRLDALPVDWIDSVQRQILILVMLLVQSLQVASILPGLPAEFDLQALSQAIQDSPSGWAVASDFATAFLLASGVLVLVRADRRSLQDIWARTVVVRPVPAPGPRG